MDVPPLPCVFIGILFGCGAILFALVWLCQWENGLENIKYKSEESLKWSADTQSVMADVSCSTDNRSKTNIFVVLHARYKDSWSDLLPLHDGSDSDSDSDNNDDDDDKVVVIV